jgi:hypothetical protein
MRDFVLGDFAANGYEPVTPLEKITTLPHASFTRGNTDRYVVTGDLPVPPEKALQDPTLLPEVIEAVRSFSWTRGYLSAAGWLDWLMNVPLARSYDLTRWHALARRSCFSRKRRRTGYRAQAQR